MGSRNSRHNILGHDGRYNHQISILKKDRGEFEVRTLPEEKTPELRQMSSSDNLLIARLNRRATPNSFCLLFKAVLIMKTRAAARRANAEYQKSESGWTRQKSQVALNTPSPRQRGNRKKMNVGEKGFSDEMSLSDEFGGTEAIEFKQKKTLLEERMDFLNCVIVVMQGDGNCQFRSASWNLFGTQEFHQYVRHKAVEHMSRNRETYEIFFMGNEFDTYLRTMGKLGTWGDELCVRAIADAFRCTIHIITSTEQNWYLRYDPQDDDSDCDRKVLHLFFTYISPIHYNSFHVDPISITPEERAFGNKAL